MKKQTKSNRQLKTIFTIFITLLFLFASNLNIAAQDGWESGDKWRGQYKVGDKIQFTISGNASDYQICTVSENHPQSVMRVKCEAFKQWVAGAYIIYGKSDIRPLPNEKNAKDTGQTKNSAGKTGLFGKLSEGINKIASNRNDQTDEYDEDENSPDTEVNESKKTAPPKLGGKLPANLGGTYWSLLSMTKRGETPKNSSAPPDVEFCKSGEWGMLHYGGTREAGNYTFSGSRLVMKYEDGSLFGDYKVTRDGNIMILEDGEYVLRLRYVSQVNC